MSHKAPFIITMGNPKGIGPEIIIKMIADASCPKDCLAVVGDISVMEEAVRFLELPVKILPITSIKEAEKYSGSLTLPVFQCGSSFSNSISLEEEELRAYLFLEQAVHFVMEGSGQAIITAPAGKVSQPSSKYYGFGHTEILANLVGYSPGDVAMMLVNDELKVVLASHHVSLSQSVHAVSFENELKTIRQAKKACENFGITNPRIAVAGINPHAGENGLFGREEKDFIIPAIKKAQEEGINATGPWSGDTIFMRARAGEFDIVVAQYHDQGLIPIKYNGIDQAVNVTIGLPFVRTSVAHGTAFDLVGLDKANHKGLLYAFKKAIDLTNINLV